MPFYSEYLKLLSTVLAGVCILAEAHAGPLHVTSLKKAAEDLGASGGMVVKIDPRLAGQPVWYESHGQSPLNVLKDLSMACHASLVRTSAGYTIARTTEDVTLCKAQHFRVAKDWLDQRLRQWDSEAARESQRGDIIRQIEDVVHQNALDAHRRAMLSTNEVFRPQAVWLSVVTPAGRLLRRLVSRIGVDRLSEIDSMDRRLFSDRPTPDESRIRNNEPDLRDFVHEESELSRAKMTTRFTADLQALGKKKIGSDQPIADWRQLKTLLIETRTQRDISLHLEVFGPAGEKLDQAFMTTSSFEPDSLPRFESKNTVRNQRSQWIPLDPISQQAVNLQFLWWTNFKPESWDPRKEPWLLASSHTLRMKYLPATFLRPEDYEPDDFVIPIGLRAIAATYPSGAVVARIPDWLWGDAMNCTLSGKLDETEFKELLFGKAECEWSPNGSDVVIRPKDPILADSLFANRRTIGRAIREMLADGTISILNRSKLFYRLGSAAISPIVEFYLDHIAGNLPGVANSTRFTDPLVFRLLGSLSNEEWDQLQRYGNVQLADSSVDVRILEKIVRCEVIPITGPQSRSDLTQHPIELFPNGLSTNIGGFISSSRELAVVMESKDGARYDMSLSSEAYLWFAMARSSVELFSRLHRSVGLERQFKGLIQGDKTLMHPAKCHKYSLIILLPGNHRMEVNLTDVGDISRESVRAIDLPDEYLNELSDDFKFLSHHMPPKAPDRTNG